MYQAPGHDPLSPFILQQSSMKQRQLRAPSLSGGRCPELANPTPTFFASRTTLQCRGITGCIHVAALGQGKTNVDPADWINQLCYWSISHTPEHTSNDRYSPASEKDDGGRFERED
jgi:hypothetical protein